MSKAKNKAELFKGRLGFVLRVTQAGLFAERLTRAFWPLWSLGFAVVAALMLGLAEYLSLELIWIAVVASVGLAVVFLVRGALRFHMPSGNDALERLDATLPGRPLQAMIDVPVIGVQDIGSRRLWSAHHNRMKAQSAAATPVQPNLRIARLDPFGLRYLAVLALMVAALFGSVSKVASVSSLALQQDLALSGAVWEGWIEPPRYTGMPTLYLNDLVAAGLDVPEGSTVSLRFYGETGALILDETVSGGTGDVTSVADVEQNFQINRSGKLAISGAGGRSWDITMIPDVAPEIAISGPASVSGEGEMSLPFMAKDDHAVTSGEAMISLDLAAISRQHGLAAAPEPRKSILMPLPLPVTGDRSAFTESLIQDFSEHPWAHLPVTIVLTAQDGAENQTSSAPISLSLPARRFFDPLAAAIIEQRRDLLWTRENAPRIAQILRAISHAPKPDMFGDVTAYLRLRFTLRRLENLTASGLTEPQRDEISQALWDLAVRFEEGNAGDAFKRLERARERLSEAMKNGANDEEIARLMQEMRQATEDYMREMARRQREKQDGKNQQLSENSIRMTQDDLQRMMDRIQDLMEEGRMAEAQQALEQLQQLMENMQITEGQGEGSPGQQSMQDLADSLRQQQELSDQAFRDLQEDFNPGSQSGQSQNNQSNSGGQGQGQSSEGTGNGQGESRENAQGGEAGKGSLADRQEALRQELERQRGALPGQDTEGGEAAREALGRADQAMDNAGNALREGDLSDALNHQSDAMEAMREGLRGLGEAMAEQQRSGSQQGTAEGAQSQSKRDPLGREAGNGRSSATDQNIVDADVYRRARDLLDEIRRRAGDTSRDTLERGYLERLLDRF